MVTHLQKAKMNQQKVKITKKDKKEIKRENLKKQIQKPTQKDKPKRRY